MTYANPYAESRAHFRPFAYTVRTRAYFGYNRAKMPIFIYLKYKEKIGCGGRI